MVACTTQSNLILRAWSPTAPLLVPSSSPHPLPWHHALSVSTILRAFSTLLFLLLPLLSLDGFPSFQGQLTQDLLYAPEYHVCTLSTVLTVCLCSLLWGLLRAGPMWSHMCLVHLCSLMPAEVGKEGTLVKVCRTLREGRDEVMCLNSRL